MSSSRRQRRVAMSRKRASERATPACGSRVALSGRVIDSGTPGTLSGLRVLVVEDVPATRTLIRVFLELEGAAVIEAGTAREALALAATCDFDVVLTDLGLPDVPGDAVITHVRALSQGRTAVAVLSGAGPHALSVALTLGAERVFRKPLAWEEIVAYLAERARRPVERSVATETEKSMRVLIIEDDAAMRALLRDVLERAGHRVVERGDGVGLPALIEQEPFDAIVLDKEMPGVNGLDLLAFLRQRLPAVPVIFITAFGGRPVAEEAARRGAFSYLEKPFRVDTILDTLAAVHMYRIGVEPD